MQRIQAINNQFKPRGVWEQTNLDMHLSAKGKEARAKTRKVMEKMKHRLEPYVDSTNFPEWVVDEVKPLGINGLQIDDFGGPGFSTIEAGSVIYEMARVDGSIAMWFLV
jgi:alkylation response protein AidB-like acyl-CoA dehydrogenase